MKPGRIIPGTLIAVAADGIVELGPAAVIFCPDIAMAASETMTPDGASIAPAIVKSSALACSKQKAARTSVATERAAIETRPSMGRLQKLSMPYCRIGCYLAQEQRRLVDSF